MTVTRALHDVLERSLRVLEAAGIATVEADPEWSSPCTYGTPDENGEVPWRPVAMDTAPDFGSLEAAIGEPLHPDLKSFYGSYWSGEVQARHGDEVVLLQTVWNPEDLRRTQEAIADHVRSRRAALGGTATVVVASTDSDFFYSVDNRTGEVQLEEPGFPTHGIAAPSLGEFLSALRVGE